MHTVFVEDLEFYGYHGVSPEEQSVGHRFNVTLTVVVGSKQLDTDDLRDTVDYSQLAQIVVDIGTRRRFKTVEALSGAICSDVLELFPIVRSVEVHVSKLLPPFAYVAKSAGVKVTVVRGEVI